MLDATQPVVLAPTSVAHSRSGTAQGALGDADLITFGMSRSFANNMVALVTDTAVSPQPRAPAVKGADGANPIEGSGAILSFKDLSLTIGEMDFQVVHSPAYRANWVSQVPSHWFPSSLVESCTLQNA